MWLIPLTETYSAADDGSQEVLLRRLKRVEEDLKKATDSNQALKTEVKSLKRKQAPPSHHNKNDDYGDSHSNGSSEVESSDSGLDSDVARQSDDPATLFASQKVSTLTPGHPALVYRQLTSTI